MKRTIIKIDEELCNGCGLCVQACHEGAIGMIEGKAVLLRDDYCDGLGDCLPVCPTGAISFEERVAAAFDEAAVKANQQRMQQAKSEDALACGCPGTASKSLHREAESTVTPCADVRPAPESRLMQWPVQIKLVPVQAPYFQGAHLLIAADCSAYAFADFHNEFMKNRVTLIGCPKLDSGDYSEKLTEIIRLNDIQSVTIVRMEVPCCGGLESAAKKALQDSGKFIPWQIVTLSAEGKILG